MRLCPNDRFMYVRTSKWSIAKPKTGRLAFWKDRDKFLVTTWDTGEVAGFYIASLTRGHYGYIKIRGEVDFDEV